MADLANLQAQISEAISRLRQLTQLNVQSGWHSCLEDLPEMTATQPEEWGKWPIATLNQREHIAWPKGRNVLWLGQRFVIPETLQGYPLEDLAFRLALTWWADSAELFVNGKQVQAGDLFDCSTRLLLSAQAQPGEAIAVALRLVSPGHDDGALVRSQCLYEVGCTAPATLSDRVEPGFAADDLAVLQQYLTQFAPEKLTVLAEAITALDWAALSDRTPGPFDQAIQQVRQVLQPLSAEIKQRQIQLLGHAHLDLAWLWPVSETWEAAERTFQSVLNLQQDFPELIFCHSTPALYDWIETNRPALFAAIQAQVQAERWEPVGGLWVEPELNTVSGESLARQVLYGQRYFQQKFGKTSAIAWLPDSFGFCWQLPQILRQGGMEYFVTQKLRWNDTTQFPYEAFQWRSPDGSEIFSLMSAPIGEGIDPIKMTNHASHWETNTGNQSTLWLPGVGDHGGGPTRDMLETARRWQTSPFFPEVEFTTAEKYLGKVRGEERGEKSGRSEERGVRRKGLESKNYQTSLTLTPPSESAFSEDSLPHPSGKLSANTANPSLLTPHSSLPTWNDELYLEFHRGCYTTHADQKRWNRRCEQLLYQAELFASLATLTTGASYPKAELETAWKQVLFNQFHDILPGSSIPEVFVDANQLWQAAEQTSSAILQTSLQAIATHIQLPDPPQPNAQPIVVFNPLNWTRSDVVTVSIPPTPEADWPGETWQVVDLSGQVIPSDVRFGGPTHTSQGIWLKRSLQFIAEDIPALGYCLFWLCPRQPATLDAPVETEDFVLENQWLRIKVDPATGDLASVFDKAHQREVLSGPGNQLQAFQDSGQYWDAWNIDPNYAQHPLPPASLIAIDKPHYGASQASLRVVRQVGRSTFSQIYVLSHHSAVVKIVTQVDWQERHVMVKAAFPLTVEAEQATYEMPYGAIARPTNPTEPRDKAKWEVPALHWADLSTDDYGVSLLNDCKYGYDAQPNQLRLTLLRSSTWPDPEADRGLHQFTYALYPHAGTWQTAHTVRRGYELNIPLQVVHLDKPRSPQPPTANLPPTGQFLNLQADNLILSAFKQAEDDPEQWILRCYETHGQPATLNLKSDLDLAIAHPVNLLEQAIDPETTAVFAPLTPQLWGELESNENGCNSRSSSSLNPTAIAPWKIVTLKILKPQP